MSLRRTRAENLALTMLARDGIAAIWQLHRAAARAHRDGHKAAAASVIEIADAAEREWLRGLAAVKGSTG
jgi:aspartate aminotransferase-like enzyme